MSALHDFITHPFFGALSGALGFFLGHRFALGREKRQEFNETADKVFEGLQVELNHIDSPFGQVEDSDFWHLRRRLQPWKRRSFDRALSDYQKAKEECTGRDSCGGVIRTTPNRVRPAILKLLTYAERR